MTASVISPAWPESDVRHHLQHEPTDPVEVVEIERDVLYPDVGELLDLADDVDRSRSGRPEHVSRIERCSYVATN